VSLAGDARRPAAGLLLPSLLAFFAFIVLLALGTWQLERKVWKSVLIGKLTSRLSAAPADFPVRAAWPNLSADLFEYDRVSFRAEYLPDKDALVWATASAMRDDVKPPGFFVFTPARLPDGQLVVVNRGFVANPRPNGASPRPAPAAGPVTILGVLRWPERPSWFQTTRYDPSDRLWFVRDQLAMAAEHQWGEVTPFYVERESQQPPDGLPSPGKLRPNLPDNHLQYALTWYGLAVVLAVIFALWVRGRRREVSASTRQSR